MLESSTIDREAVAQSLLGLMVPAPPLAPPDAQQNGVSNKHYRHVRCNETWEQARRGDKHEQSETHNENDDRRDAATRRYQEPQTFQASTLHLPSLAVELPGSIHMKPEA